MVVLEMNAKMTFQIDFPEQIKDEFLA